MAMFIGVLAIITVMAIGAFGIAWGFVEANADYKLMIQYNNGQADWIKLNKA